MRNADGVSYPPAPWHLRGTAYVSLWRVRADELPVACLPPDARPVTLLGRAVVGTGWAVYGTGGVLAYHEVLAAVRVRLAGRPYTTVTHIWVDHPASLAGARELWSIPKQLAALRVRRVGGGGNADFAASAASLDGRPIAALRFQGRTVLPGRWRLRTRTAQRSLGHGRGEGLKIARAEARASVELGAATWDFAPEGPLGFLRAHEPFVSVRLAGLSLRFGG
jgi:hypothetical protein